MTSAICTLFEGNYHYGVGALTNSLYKNAYRGIVWVGYRGEIPFWANPLVKETNFSSFKVAEGCEIRFVELETTYHLTNYKPTFMLDLWEHYCPDVDALFYFDPDIVIKCEWNFFEKWTKDRVALCEDVNSPLNTTAPERLNWIATLAKYEFEIPDNTINHYINGGFVGVSKKNRVFLESWKNIMEIAAKEVGSLDFSFLPSVNGKTFKKSRTTAFFATDQDALNCAAMKHEHSISVANRHAMDFGSFGYIMSHALGSNKPWKARYLKDALDGRRVSNTHKLYWRNVLSPISLYSKTRVSRTNLLLKLASFISNFYAR